MRNIRGRVLPTLMVLIGVTLIVKSIISIAVVGIILGILFIGAGIGRMYLERRL
jgi:hypothetical protein